MFASIDSDTRDDIIQTVAYYPDTDQIHSPRKVRRPWDGSREQLIELSTDPELLDHPECVQVLKELTKPKVFDQLELQSVDGVLIEDNLEPIVHIQCDDRASSSYETLTIDLTDVRCSVELVEVAQTRERHRMWRMFSLVGLTSAAILFWWKQK